MSFCSNCGNQLEDNANFCNKCGKQQSSANLANNASPPCTVTTPNARERGKELKSFYCNQTYYRNQRAWLWFAVIFLGVSLYFCLSYTFEAIDLEGSAYRRFYSDEIERLKNGAILMSITAMGCSTWLGFQLRGLRNIKNTYMRIHENAILGQNIGPLNMWNVTYEIFYSDIVSVNRRSKGKVVSIEIQVRNGSGSVMDRHAICVENADSAISLIQERMSKLR